MLFCTYEMPDAVWVLPPLWYRMLFTAEVTADADMPCASDSTRALVLLYCTTPTRVLVDDDPTRKRWTTELMKVLDVAKLLAPTLPEPSTKKTRSAALDCEHVETGAFLR
mmetsp:Transcript_22300/g.67020  ORF Transcript_22300/g.67020 Transcript_22300/m.67020 type:complete len:110 (+) Transcript_22300:1281-1610(+)